MPDTGERPGAADARLRDVAWDVDRGLARGVGSRRAPEDCPKVAAVVRGFLRPTCAAGPCRRSSRQRGQGDDDHERDIGDRNGEPSDILALLRGPHRNLLRDEVATSSRDKTRRRGWLLVHLRQDQRAPRPCAGRRRARVRSGESGTRRRTPLDAHRVHHCSQEGGTSATTTSFFPTSTALGW